MHNHRHKTGRNLIWAIFINSIIVVFEIFFGIIIGSMALVADAFHNFTDIGSMSLSLFGEKLAKRPSNNTKTFGYKRAEIIIALINSSVLFAVIMFIFIESVRRIFMPHEISGINMFLVAIVALVGNGIATFLLEKDSHKNLNLKSAWLHSLQDALFSLGVVIAAIIIYYTGLTIIDPLISIFIALFLSWEAIKIIKQSINIMMDSVPDGIEFKNVQKYLMDIEGVLEVKDLHIWQTGSHNKLATVHLIISEEEKDNRTKLLKKAKKTFFNNFGINHSTIQIVTSVESKKIGELCTHCN